MVLTQVTPNICYLFFLLLSLSLSLKMGKRYLDYLVRFGTNVSSSIEQLYSWPTESSIWISLLFLWGWHFVFVFLKEEWKTLSLYTYFSREISAVLLVAIYLFVHCSRILLHTKKKLKSVIAAIRPLYIVQCRVSLVSFVQKIVTMCLFYHTSCWCRFPSTLLRYTNNLQWRYTVIICVHYCTALLNMKLD